MNKVNRFKNYAILGILGVALVSSLTLISCSTDETQTVTTLTNLVMEEEFEVNGAPDPGMWSFETGTGQNGWGNNELQYYTDRPENVVVENGMLKITALRESFEGQPYTSGRIITKGLFEQQYGRIEARIQIPFGSGVWPAFWMLGNDIDQVSWPQCGEIDIFENFGRSPSVIGGAVHGPGYNAGLAISKEYELEGDRFDTGFHIFGIEWGPNYINFYVDDTLYNQITPEDVTGEWVFDHPFFILLNVAVGGDPVGSPANTEFPKTMYVDYIKVYE